MFVLLYVVNYQRFIKLQIYSLFIFSILQNTEEEAYWLPPCEYYTKT